MTFDGVSWILRELQPSKDRLRLEAETRLPRMREVVTTMAQIVAWDQLRASGRQGAATADELIELGHDTSWATDLVSFAEAYSHQARADWQGLHRWWRSRDERGWGRSGACARHSALDEKARLRPSPI